MRSWEARIEMRLAGGYLQMERPSWRTKRLCPLSHPIRKPELSLEYARKPKAGFFPARASWQEIILMSLATSG